MPATTINLKDYFIPEYDDSYNPNRPFFSVDSEVDAKLAKHDGMSRMLFGAYQGKLPIVYDWQISGKPVPMAVVLSNIKQYNDYEKTAEYQDQSELASQAILHLLASRELLAMRPHLQTQYKLCDINGKPTDNFMPVTGLQSVIALSHIVGMGSDELTNVLETSHDCESISFLQTVNYLSASSLAYAPLLFDKDFLLEAVDDTRDEDDDDAVEGDGVLYDLPEQTASSMLVCVDCSVIERFNDAVNNSELEANDWATALVRRYNSPKYRLKKACSVAQSNMDVFALWAAAILGLPFSATERYLDSSNSRTYLTMSASDRVDVINDMKPLLENISLEV